MVDREIDTQNHNNTALLFLHNPLCLFPATLWPPKQRMKWSPTGVYDIRYSFHLTNGLGRFSVCHVWYRSHLLESTVYWCHLITWHFCRWRSSVRSLPEGLVRKCQNYDASSHFFFFLLLKLSKEFHLKWNIFILSPWLFPSPSTSMLPAERIYQSV